MMDQYDLSNVKLFKNVDHVKINQLMAGCKHQTYSTNEIVFRENDPSLFVVLVIEGNLKVVHNSFTLANVIDNEIVGEMGVFTSLPRSADVVATTTSKCVVIPKESLNQFLEKNPKEAKQIFTNVITVLAQHLKNNNFIIELSQLEVKVSS